MLKPRFLPTIGPTQFNYHIDILGKWQANRYRFVQRYRSGFPENLGEEFEAPFTRLDWLAHDRFNILCHGRFGERSNQMLKSGLAIDDIATSPFRGGFNNRAPPHLVLVPA